MDHTEVLSLSEEIIADTWTPGIKPASIFGVSLSSLETNTYADSVFPEVHPEELVDLESFKVPDLPSNPFIYNHVKATEGFVSLNPKVEAHKPRRTKQDRSKYEQHRSKDDGERTRRTQRTRRSRRGRLRSKASGFTRQSFPTSLETKAEWDIIAKLPVNDLKAPWAFTAGKFEDVAGTYVGVPSPVAAKLQSTIRRRQNPAVVRPEAPLPNPSAWDAATVPASEGPTIVIDHDTLSALMSASRSRFGWDISVTKEGERMTFRRRDETLLNVEPVFETAQHLPYDERKPDYAPAKLSAEESAVYHGVRGMMAPGSPQTLWRRAAIAGDRPLTVLAHCTREMAVQVKEKVKDEEGRARAVVRQGSSAIRVASEMSFKALKTGWRQQIANGQTGSIIADLFNRDGFRLSRWLASGLICGVDELMLVYASRRTPLSGAIHDLVGVESMNMTTFSQQFGMTDHNVWTNVLALVSLLDDCGDGEYVMVKDAKRQTVNLYNAEDVFGEE
eukprot:gnl/Dysnectes_brevis/452_a504_3933.p1 GENE.gnl/Dysnectes_brevis/452_a504_3933~~gnl/Dysnectes_brevis/452_a504_3933.p1  ORF type:complete len:513 (-),score=148.93 gnl/Dysnectes_brevis/452_a504_3933:31-1539(-)